MCRQAVFGRVQFRGKCDSKILAACRQGYARTQGDRRPRATLAIRGGFKSARTSPTHPNCTRRGKGHDRMNRAATGFSDTLPRKVTRFPAAWTATETAAGMIMPAKRAVYQIAAARRSKLSPSGRRQDPWSWAVAPTRLRETPTAIAVRMPPEGGYPRSLPPGFQSAVAASRSWSSRALKYARATVVGPRRPDPVERFAWVASTRPA